MADIPQWPYENFFGNPPTNFFPHSGRMPYIMPDCDGSEPAGLCPIVNVTIDIDDMECAVSFTTQAGVSSYSVSCQNSLGFQTFLFDTFGIGETLQHSFPTVAGDTNTITVNYTSEGVEYVCASQDVVTPISRRLIVGLANTPETACNDLQLGNTGVWVAVAIDTISEGVTVYQNRQLTIPVEGFAFIATGSIGGIFNLSGATVGTSTGVTC